MGKYMRKSKSSTEVSLMEVSQSSSLGVRTRARTLALRRLQGSATAAAVEDSGGSYLQLRSRRLEKCSTYGGSKRQRQQPKEESRANPNPNSTPNSKGNSSPNSKLRVDSASKKEEGCLEAEKVVEEEEEKNSDDVAIEASFGENLLEIEGRERSSRETTPCSLIRDPNTVQTPGSSTRRASSSLEPNRVVRNPTLQQIPATREMEELFATAEKEQQKEFIKKYNYDPVKDKPLPGRYEWVKIDP